MADLSFAGQPAPARPLSSTSGPFLHDPDSIAVYLSDLPNTVVITWLNDKYQYAAIKIHDRWYTTATTENPYVEHEMTSEEMAAALLYRQPQIATGWRRFHEAPF